MPVPVSMLRVEADPVLVAVLGPGGAPGPAGDGASCGSLAEVARARRDRRRLWRRLYADGLWLAVLPAEPAGGSRPRVLAVPRGGQSFVLGASTEPVLATIVGERVDPARLVHVPGHHLAAVWPRGHHLVVDAGTPHAAVLTPAEVAGLPAGPSVGHVAATGVEVTSPSVGLGHRMLAASGAGSPEQRRGRR